MKIPFKNVGEINNFLEVQKLKNISSADLHYQKCASESFRQNKMILEGNLELYKSMKALEMVNM